MPFLTQGFPPFSHKLRKKNPWRPFGPLSHCLHFLEARCLNLLSTCEGRGSISFPGISLVGKTPNIPGPSATGYGVCLLREFFRKSNRQQFPGWISTWSTCLCLKGKESGREKAPLMLKGCFITIRLQNKWLFPLYRGNLFTHSKEGKSSLLSQVNTKHVKVWHNEICRRKVLVD